MRRVPHGPARGGRRASRLQLPLIPGHEIVGESSQVGTEVKPRAGERVGVPWLGGPAAPAPTASAARRTSARARASPATPSTAATPSTRSPTSATPSRFRPGYSDAEAAPLLCAGLIGYRALPDGRRRRGPRPLRLRRRRPPRRAGRPRARAASVYAFTRPGDTAPKRSRASLGAAGRAARTSARPSPSTPRSSSRPWAHSSRRRWRAVRPGGTWSVRGIHMSDIPSFPYRCSGASASSLGREPHARGRCGVHAARGERSVEARGPVFSARGRERSTHAATRRPTPRRCRPCQSTAGPFDQRVCAGLMASTSTRPSCSTRSAVLPISQSLSLPRTSTPITMTSASPCSASRLSTSWGAPISSLA